MTDEILWRFLVIDDRQADDIEEFVAEHKVLEAPDKVVVEKCTKFKDALDFLNEKRIDLVILDLKDDSIVLEEEKPLAGEEVFNLIRKTRFIPVVFYTAYPMKMDGQENPYVRVVKRGNPRALRKAITEVFETRLPQLIRFLEDEQRVYMWDYLQTHWQESASSYEQTDLTYLLARRLANSLERRSIRRFLAGQDDGGPQESEPTIHPIEMYIYPPTNPKYQAGDIFKSPVHGKDRFCIVLTPSCDLEHEKADYVISAACVPLKGQPEYRKVKNCVAEGQIPSGNERTALENLISNNRNSKNIQRERFMFLPGTFFIPDLVIDFQDLVIIPMKEVKKENRIASLDSPFAEACSASFSKYYGRLGTPDIDKGFVYKRVVESIKKKKK
jgi:CheY-like chemotaxis protein